MANLLIKAPQLGIIDPIVDVYFARAKKDAQGNVKYEKIENLHLYEKVYIIFKTTEVNGKVLTFLNVRLFYYENKKGKIFLVKHDGIEKEIIIIPTSKEEENNIYFGIAEIDLFQEDTNEMDSIKKLIPLNLFLELGTEYRKIDNDVPPLEKIGTSISYSRYYYPFTTKVKCLKIKGINAPWMEMARTYIGTYEDKSSANNPIIQGWIEKHNQDFNLIGKRKTISIDNEPWCGVFVYNMLVLSGVRVERGKSWEHPSKASFYNTNWKNSVKIESPQYGAIAKMKWSHVTFIYNFDDTFVWVLGGNQPENGSAVRDGVVVNIAKYKISQVEEMRMPEGY